MKKNLFKIVAGLSPSTAGLPDEISKAISGLGCNLYVKGQIQAEVSAIFLPKVSEKQAADFVSFVLNDLKAINPHRQLALLKYHIHSVEQFREGAKMYSQIINLKSNSGRFDLLIAKFSAMKNPSDSACPPSPASSISSFASQEIPAKNVFFEEDFGFGPDDVAHFELLAVSSHETLSLGTVSSSQGYIVVNTNMLSSDQDTSNQDNLIRYALNIYSGLNNSGDKNKIVPIFIDMMKNLGRDEKSSVIESMRLFEESILSSDKELRPKLTIFIDAVDKYIEDPKKAEVHNIFSNVAHADRDAWMMY